jgi:hypothetical protein
LLFHATIGPKAEYVVNDNTVRLEVRSSMAAASITCICHNRVIPSFASVSSSLSAAARWAAFLEEAHAGSLVNVCPLSILAQATIEKAG